MSLPRAHLPHLHHRYRRRSGGLQQERNALAWERTAFSVMGAGLVLARFTAVNQFWILAGTAVVIVVLGSGLLVWAGSHYEDRLDLVHHGDEVVHPTAARYVGLITMATTALCLMAGAATMLLR